MPLRWHDGMVVLLKEGSMAKFGRTMGVRASRQRGSEIEPMVNLKSGDAVTVYEPNNRPQLSTLTPDKFSETFLNYKELLVDLLKNEVVAATRGDDRDAMVDEYCDRFDVDKESMVNFTFQLTPNAAYESAFNSLVSEEGKPDEAPHKQSTHRD
jgi:hypothetical protein